MWILPRYDPSLIEVERPLPPHKVLHELCPFHVDGRIKEIHSMSKLEFARIRCVFFGGYVLSMESFVLCLF